MTRRIGRGGSDDSSFGARSGRLDRCDRRRVPNSRGAAEGLGVLCGNRPWAGNLLTGSLLVAGLTSAMFMIFGRLKKLSREGTVAKYENRKFRQQARYGHDVADRAAAYDPEPHGPNPNRSQQK